MKKIIVVLFFTCLACSTPAIAKETNRHMEEFKQKLIQHIDSEIEILTQFKACIRAAQQPTDFEACKNSKNEAQKKEMVEIKKERLKNRKEQLAIQEKQLNEAAKLEKK